MITKQHTITTAIAHNRALKKMGFSHNEAKAKTEDFIKRKIHLFLYPDAIRYLVGPRQAGHFETVPDGSDTSYMIYPPKEMIPLLTRENVEGNIEYYVSPKCVKKCIGSDKAVAIGEHTQLDVFSAYNSGSEYYHELKTHLQQDICLDTVFRERLVDNERMYEDIYINRATGEEIDGKEARGEAFRFEEVGFISLAGMCYHETGILPTREWFDEHVKSTLEENYCPEMAANTYKYMGISEEVNERFKNKEFALTEEEIASVKTADCLEEILTQLYEEAIAATMVEIEYLI